MSDLKLQPLMLQKIREAGLPEPKQEFMFIPGRRYRADFAWPCGVILECDGTGGQGPGGTGGHQTRTGIHEDHLRDAEAECSLNAWRVIRVDRRMVESGLAVLLVEDALATRRSIPRRPELAAEMRSLLAQHAAQLSRERKSANQTRAERKAAQSTQKHASTAKAQCPTNVPATPHGAVQTRDQVSSLTDERTLDEIVQAFVAKHPGTWLEPKLECDLRGFSRESVLEAVEWANDNAAELRERGPRVAGQAIMRVAEEAERRLRS